MDKYLHARIRRSLGGGAYLVERKLPRQHYLREAGAGEHSHLGRSAGVGLSAGVQLDGRYIHRREGHVLHDERVDTDFVQLGHESARLVELAVVYDGIEGDVDLYAVGAGIFHHPAEVVERVAGCGTRSKRWPADIHGVGAVDDCRDSRIGIARRGEQLQGRGHLSAHIRGW